MDMEAFKIWLLEKVLFKSHCVHLGLCNNEILMFVHVCMFYVILQILDRQTSKKMTKTWEIVEGEIHESLGTSLLRSHLFNLRLKDWVLCS